MNRQEDKAAAAVNPRQAGIAVCRHVEWQSKWHLDCGCARNKEIDNVSVAFKGAAAVVDIKWQWVSLSALSGSDATAPDGSNGLPCQMAKQSEQAASRLQDQCQGPTRAVLMHSAW